MAHRDYELDLTLREFAKIVAGSVLLFLVMYAVAFAFAVSA
jgi:hypothetical protein